MILWSIWKSHNSKLWENSDTPPSTIVRRAKDSLHEWQVMQRAKQPRQGTHQEHKWLKPLPATMKCNVDCALFNNNTITGYGLCFRDSTGQLVLGMSNYAFFSSSSTEAEALGLLEAIKLAVERGYQSVTFESDCRFVVEAVNTTQVPQNEVGDIISSCQELLSFHNHFSVKYVRRQANEVAHSIARASLSYPRPHIFNDVPSYLYPLIMNEMA
jgi:ribonuclease HI